MATPQRYLSAFSRSVASAFSQPVRPHTSSLAFLCPLEQQTRSLRTNPKKSKEKPKKKRVNFKQYDLKDAVQFTLCDAMRYIRAFEAGKDIKTVKYEVHVKLRTKKDGPVLRNQIRLPHVVRSDIRICVICPPGSRAAKEAADAGAEVIGESEVFEAVKAGKIEFDRCICHSSSLPNLNKAALGRILGPRGLMPSAKLGTVVDSVGTTVKNMRAGSFYRERAGVVKLAIGQLGFSPEQLKNNLGTFIGQVKKDAAGISDQVSKEIAEVVLSSTNAPGFSLNGEFKGTESPPMQALTGH